MSGIYKGLSWVASLTVLTWAIVGGLSIEHLATVGGEVRASCSLLATRPLAQVYTLSGESLGGDAWTSTEWSTDTPGTCTAGFSVDNVRREDFYRVELASMSTTVDWAYSNNVYVGEH